VGLREVTTVGRELRVNGEKVYLRGADHHQDAALRGKGVDAVTQARDVAMMESVGMNAVRLNSWPAPELLLDLADEVGIMVQSEASGIALRSGWDPDCTKHIFRPTNNSCANTTTRDQHIRLVTELMERDRARTSVISWSMARCSFSFWQKNMKTKRAVEIHACCWLEVKMHGSQQVGFWVSLSYHYHRKLFHNTEGE
jgi:beta-galactosidase/beta-glucuronidase